jgi:hypothetical protein
MTTPRRPCPVDYPHNTHAYFNPAWGGLMRDEEPYRLRCPGRDLDAVKRGRVFSTSARREVLRQLRASSRYLGWAIGSWAVDGSVRDERGQSERPRKVSEWPENNPKEWRQLASTAEHLAKMFARLARDAADNARTIEQLDDDRTGA